METDKGQDFSGVHMEDANFSGARLHAPNFEGAKITDGWFKDADISGYLGGLRLNGVEVWPLVQEEIFKKFPEMRLLQSETPEGLAEGWAFIEDLWEKTVARARKLPEEKLRERVNGEWSFVETLRHLLLATDCWLLRMVHGREQPYHPWGLGGGWLEDPQSWGLYHADPSLDEVLAARAERMGMVKDTIQSATPQELKRQCVPPATLGHPTEPHTVLQCLHVILEEEWEHSKYANRDLDVLEAG